MSDLKNNEKLKLEKLFEMQSGYVCNFSDRTFGNFILDSTGVDVYEPGYDELGTSKANRLRNFWRKESNYQNGKLIEEMLDYWKAEKISLKNKFPSSDEVEDYNQFLHDECLKIVERLKNNTPIDDLDKLAANNSDKNFTVLLESIKDSVNKDKPDLVIDRLHTYVIKHIRFLCDKHLIKYTKETALHSLFGMYVKELEKKKLIDSKMALLIMKSSISLLDSFNDVRNNQSLAHDNQILNYDESVLIFNNIINLIKFIDNIESKNDKKILELATTSVDDIRLEDIPF
jgi:hypothetical protein